MTCFQWFVSKTYWQREQKWAKIRRKRRKKSLGNANTISVRGSWTVDWFFLCMNCTKPSISWNRICVIFNLNFNIRTFSIILFFVCFFFHYPNVRRIEMWIGCFYVLDYKSMNFKSSFFSSFFFWWNNFIAQRDIIENENTTNIFIRLI